MRVYKVLRPEEWARLQSEGLTAGVPVDLADGFIHLSTAEQLPGTLRKHFAEEGELELLAAESEALGADLAWELSRGGARFPHLYRPLYLLEVVWHAPLPPGADGHELPADLA